MSHVRSFLNRCLSHRHCRHQTICGHSDRPRRQPEPSDHATTRILTQRRPPYRRGAGPDPLEHDTRTHAGIPMAKVIRELTPWPLTA
jgi:hypothetical protein